MTCRFTSFLIVFRTYQDHMWVIMTALQNGTAFTFTTEKVLDSLGLETKDHKFSGPALNLLATLLQYKWKW